MQPGGWQPCTACTTGLVGLCAGLSNLAWAVYASKPCEHKCIITLLPSQAVRALPVRTLQCM